MSPPALAVRNLSVDYGVVQALRDVTLEVPDGGIVAVLGGNGAGKSTLLRAVSGVLGFHRGVVRSGEIAAAGRSINGSRPDEIVAAGVVQVPEGRHVFARMTVGENLRAGALGARDRTRTAQAHDRVMELFPVLAERTHQRAGLLSGGEQQMLAIGRALMSRPRLLLLDEPSLGLAPIMIGRIAQTITEINRTGTAILLIEQNAMLALELARYAYVLEVGSVALSGPADELAGSDEVRHLYLGSSVESVEDLLEAPDGTGAAVGADAGDLAGAGVPTLTRWTG